MTRSKLVISLDFELFWGVTDVRKIDSYKDNVLGEWEAIPKILDQFERYEISATWASVGMVMCKNFDEWTELIPQKLPKYKDQKLSNYNYGNLAKEFPKLFFGQELLKEIISCPKQEIGTHSFSHFYYNEEGIDKEDMEIDLKLALKIGSSNNIEYSSIVFPRNQYNSSILDLLPIYGIKSYRGNLDHFLYRDGHFVRGGKFGRPVRFLDNFFPIHSKKTYPVPNRNKLTNIPAGFFLQPVQGNPRFLNPLKLKRLKNQMTKAAKNKEVFHLWWHPHNFGVSQSHNIDFLTLILKHYKKLKEEYGMESHSMSSL